MDPHDLPPTKSSASREVWPNLRAVLEKAPWSWLVTSSIKERFEARAELGRARYGQLLSTHDGRDMFRDFREELYDALVYLHKIYMEGGIWPPMYIAMSTQVLGLIRLCDITEARFRRKHDP